MSLPEIHDAHAARRAALDAQEADLARSTTAEEARARRIASAQAAARARRGRPPAEEVVRSAHHEAGHAVCALALGRSVRGVLIDGDGRGVCWYAHGDGAGAPALAGAVAERTAGHVAAAASLADLRLAGSVQDAALAQFDAEEVLAANHDRVASLAEALLERGFLDGPLVQAIGGAPLLVES